MENNNGSQNDDRNLFIIKSVEVRPCLYDKTLTEYKRKDKKAHAWEEIVTLYKDCFQEIETAKAIRARWTSLKKLFTEENRKKHPYTPSGSAAPEEEDVCRFPYYQEMMFMEKHVRHRKTEGNFHFGHEKREKEKEEEEEEEEEETIEEAIEEYRRRKEGNAYAEDFNFDDDLIDDQYSKQLLNCGETIEILLQEAMENELSTPLSGYSKEIVKAFENLPENEKLNKFNKIIDIIEAKV